MKKQFSAFPAWGHSLVAALLLWAAWPVSPLSFLVFFGFIPLLYLGTVTPSRRRFMLYAALAMAVWNGLTTWWIWNASGIGVVAAVLVNTLVMLFPWFIYHIVLKRKGTNWGGYAWLLAWLSMEYFHLQNWGLSWPWMTLGNVFATQPDWVQWYEITGTSGGSCWVLLVNLLLFRLLTAETGFRRISVAAAATILVPLILSFSILQWRAGIKKQEARNVVVVQPNIDPYEEKFLAGTQEMQIQQLIRLSQSQIDDNTELVIWPETAIPVQAWEEELKQNYFFYPVYDFLQRHPGVKLFTGIDGYRRLPKDAPKTLSVRRLGDTDQYYEAFNSGALIHQDTSIQLYHKSRLVPGVEMIPSWLGFMASLAGEFGGIAGTYGSQEERTVLGNEVDFFKIAPSICYESVYGEFMASYARNGANIIAIITNDGWWGNTPGYKQHMQYARLRAIENRRWVARSANTGISCFIDPLGEIYQPQPWDEPSAIKQQIFPSQTLTFFSRYGDVLSKAALLLLATLLIATFTIKNHALK